MKAFALIIYHELNAYRAKGIGWARGVTDATVGSRIGRSILKTRIDSILPMGNVEEVLGRTQ